MKKILLALVAIFAFASSAYAAGPTCAVGASGVAPTANLSFPAVTLNTDGSAIAAPVTYNLYQGTATGAEVKVATALVAGTANVIKTGLLANTSYYWYVTAVDAAGSEGAPSNEGCKSFSKVVPGTTTITIS